MHAMKALALHSVLLAFASMTIGAEVIYSQPFSDPSSPAWYCSTVNDTPFGESWSMTSHLAGDPPNQFAHFDISIPVRPTNPNARWYGGFSTFLPGLTNLPPEWQLSFQAFFTNLEPLRVQFQTIDTLWPVPGTPPTNPPSIKTLALWCHPAASGWQTFHLDRHSASIAGQSFGPMSRLGLRLMITLASHDSDSQPLSISQIGRYTFLLDEVALAVGPAQPALSVCGTATNTLVLSWPATSAGLTLQTNSSLSTPHWDYWSVLPSDDGTNKSVVVTPTGTMFYRLKD